MTKAQLLAEVEGLRALLERERATRLEIEKTLAGALEQQTATSEILRVISSSPADLSQAGATILANATRLCEAELGNLFVYDRHAFHAVAHHNASQPFRDVLSGALRPDPETGVERLLEEPSPFQIADLRATAAYRDGEPYAVVAADLEGIRTLLAVPFARDGQLVGVITIYRREIRPFTPKQIELVKVFADQAVIAIENVRLFTELQEKNRALTEAHGQVTEALEQQTATSEILRVISSSPTDVQPVFEAIAASAVRLCGAVNGAVFRFDGELIHIAAYHNISGDQLGPWQRQYPATVESRLVTARAILSRAAVQVEDLTNDPWYAHTPVAQAGYRTVLSVPMMRDGLPIGAVNVTRMEVRPFSPNQVALLQTFADQAVIAIENVRLFAELQQKNRALTEAHAQVTEALEQQTATSDILRVISQSPTDVQPVFDAIVANAVRLCHGNFGAVHRYDGALVHLVAHHNIAGEALEYLRRLSPQPPGKAILERCIVRIADFEADPEVTEAVRIGARLRGSRSNVTVPMLRHGKCLGIIVVGKRDPGFFADEQIQLLQTFAAQAVIAIENVRLFTELQQKNEALTHAHAQVTEALEQQTATGDILRVIARSPTDVQPVFDTIVRNAVQLCGARFGVLHRFDGERLHLVAHDVTPEVLDVLQRTYPMSPSRSQASGRAILTRGVAEIRDVREDPDYRHDMAAAGEWRSLLAVPMLRADGSPIGTIVVQRSEPGPFAASHIEMLKTFADQAVIAVENVRLFKELEARTQDLTRSVGELRALGEVGQAISSSLDLRTVLSTIVARATELSGTDAGVIYEYDEQRQIFVPRATEHLEAEIVETMLATPVRKGEGATGRLAEVQEPIQVPDILGAPAESRVRGALVRAGYKALLAVPLVREDHLIGGLTVIRKATGEFAPEIIDLLRTFATQSALAIQNARLFLEIEDKSRQLEVASQHKSEFLANMSHELRTPLNAIIGFSEVLTERMFGDLNEKQDEYLKDIHAAGSHLLSLINDILDLSKIEAGRMELELTDFDLPTALDNALTLVRERAGRRGITLDKSVDERLGQVRADERKIRQVVLNLLSNAIKFTPEGGRIAVGAVPRDGFVEVSVSDTGIGIAPEDQEAIFEEFRQVGTADKKVEGTGLGLALSRKFVELHGGKIWVTSQVGVGSTFTLTIPVSHGE